MIQDKNKVEILWGLFALTIILPLLDIFLNSINLFLPYLTILKFILPIIVLLWHSFYLFGLLNSALLLMPSFIIGFLFEIIGVNFGIVFGGNYFYNVTSLGPIILGVPILIPFFWSFFIYTGYIITSSFLVWMDIPKPSKINKNIWLVPLLIIIDGLVVVAIDLFMDPIMVSSHNWTWNNGGVYFGIPLGNFVGWFLVTILSTGIFRVYEYYFPIIKSRRTPALLLIPVIGYLSLIIIFSILALNLELYKVTLVGIVIMLPIVLLNLYLFIKKYDKISK